MSVTSTGYRVGKQPIAQSFYIDDPAGIYCTKVDLFFKAADENAPIQVQIRPMVNGFPSSNTIIPGTIKSLAGSTFSGGASISADATTATTFEFDEPTYLKGLNEYALVVIADSKDYEIYIAEINDFVVGSTEKRVNKQPVLGSLFYSQNGSTFTPSQNQDLTFKIYQAKFKHSTATIALHNAPVPKQLLNPNPLKTISTSQTVRVTHANHGMQVGQPITLSGVDSAGVGGISASTLNQRHTITAIDHTGYTFTLDSAADSDAFGGGTTIQSTKNILYNNIYPSIAALIPTGQQFNASVKTTTGKSYAGIETAFQKQPSFESVQINENNSKSTLMMIAHDSAETSDIGAGIKSLDFNISIVNADSNMAPMLDLQRTSVGLISNIIDKQNETILDNHNVPLAYVDETSARGGSSAAKHLTKTIVLNEEAVGLKVLLSANRPSTADFQVYFRTADADTSIVTQNFILASQETVIPTDENPSIFREYTYLIGGQGGDIAAFTKFQLKIVFRSTNQALVPSISSLRAIALSA